MTNADSFATLTTANEESVNAVAIAAIKNLFNAVSKKIPEAEIIMDVYTSKAVRASRYKNPIKEVGALPSFGIDKAAIFEKEKVNLQTAELGKIDAGGGGTVAMYIANHNIETVDLGVPVISMHAPYEVISKADLYSTYEAFCAFVK